MRRSYERDPESVEKAPFVDPVPIDCAKIAAETPDFVRDGSLEKPLNVVCVKYGTKYGADYVNKLYYGVKKHLSLPHTFTCFTESPTDLDPSIIVQPLKHAW